MRKRTHVLVTLTRPKSDNSMYPKANVHATHAATSMLMQEQSLTSCRWRRCHCWRCLARAFLLRALRVHLGCAGPHVVGTCTRLVLRVRNFQCAMTMLQELELLRHALLAAEFGAQLAFLRAGGHALLESVLQKFAVLFLSFLLLLFLVALRISFGFAGRQGGRPCSQPHDQRRRTSHGCAVRFWWTLSFVWHCGRGCGRL